MKTSSSDLGWRLFCCFPGVEGCDSFGGFRFGAEAVVSCSGCCTSCNGPVTMSQSQSAIPPGTASTAVCGQYTLTPSRARRRRDDC